MFNFYNSKCRWLRTLSVAVFFVLVGSGGAFAQATYFSKAVATDFTAAASWGLNADGSGAAPGSVSNADNFIIANSSVMNLAAGSAAVRNLTINAGSLTIGANTLTVSLPTGNTAALVINTGGTLTASGGNITVNGFVTLASGGTMNQSAGTIMIDGNDNNTPASSVPSGTSIFGVTALAASNFNLTGGTVHIVDPHVVNSTSLGMAFGYQGSVDMALGVAHTFLFGNGASTQGTANTGGFVQETYVGSTRVRYGNLTINTGATSPQNLVTQRFTGQHVGVQGTFTVTSGDYRNSGVLVVSGNVVNNGTLTTTGTLAFSNGSGTTTFVPSTNAQTISGTGVYRNIAGVGTANFAGLRFNNTHASGVTFSDANSVLSGANTGTASGTVTMENGIVNLSGNTFIMGISNASTNVFGTFLGGGFASGTTVRKWMSATGIPTALSATVPTIPFHTGTAQHHVFLARSGAMTTGGWIEVTHTNAAGFTPGGFLDGAYSVDQRTNASWALTSGGGLNLGAQTLTMGLKGEGLVVTAAAPGTAPRLVQAAGALKTHTAATGTTAAPTAIRSALVLADLAAGPHYIGIANADIGLYSIATGNWNNPLIWSTGAVPTAASNPLISSGNTVTVNSAETCLTTTVAGTLTVSGSTLDVVGASGTGIAFAGAGTLNVSGGTVNIGPQDNSFCNRRLDIVSGSTLNVSSGNLNLAGQFFLRAGGNLVQSGGTIKVDGNAANVSANSVPAGSIVDFTVSAQGNLNVTAGTFWIVDPHCLNATSNRAFGNNTGSNVACGAGHTFRFGNGASTDATANTGGFVQETYIGSTRILYGNLIIDAGATSPQNLITQQFTGQFVGVQGDMTITSGDYRNSGVLTIAGNLVNNGILTTTGTLAMSNSSGTGTYVTATTASTISGSGTFQNLAASPTASLANFRVQNTHASGVTMSVPLSVSAGFTMAEGKLNTTSINLLTLSSLTGNVFTGTGTVGYVSGPVRRIAPASSTNLAYFFPVGQTQANWFAVYNFTTNAGGSVTLDVTGDNSLGAPNTFDPSLTSVNTGREWTTTVVSGLANITSYSMQGYDAGMVNGNALAGIQSPATDFSVLGTGSNWAAAAAPMPPYLTTTLPPLAGSTFPDRVSYGNTGPLNVSGATAFQVTGAVARGTTNNDLTRLVVSAVGSSGTITLTDLIWTYTGSSAADIAASGITLWTGTFAAPVAQVGLGVSLSGGFATFSGMSINIPSGATYLWVRANVAAGATIGNVIDGKVETGNMSFAASGGATFTPPIPAADLDPAGTRLIDYCAPTYASGCGSGDDITNVVLGTLSNASACTPNPYYTYYSAATVPNLQQGSGYTLNVTMGTDGTQYSGVWIDFDQDGVFATTEYFSTGTSAGANGTSAISITVPGLALTGITRMRIRGGNDAILVNTQACGASSSGFGETEDYRVNITSPSPRALDPITSLQVAAGMGISTTNNNLLRVDLPTSGSLGTLTLTDMVFSYTGTSAADIAASGVSLWTGTSSAPSAQVGSSVSLSGGLATFSGLSVALGSNNYLWLRVNTSASAVIANLVDAKVVTGDITIVAAGGATAPGSQPTADVDPAGNSFIDYCPSTYASGCGLGDDITNVVLNGNSINLNNPTGCTANPYYSYFSAANKPDLFQGSTYSISVSVGTDGNQWVGCWIDFDQDGLLETTEYFEKTSVTGASSTATFNIVVPITATLGNTRMRIRGGNDSQLLNTQACGASSSGFGETEDYIITVIPPPNCSTLLPFPATAATASPTTVCSGSSVLFGITVPMPSGTGITYQWRRNGTNVGAPVATPTNSIVVTTGGNYDVVILCNGTPQVTSAVVAVTSLNPTIATTTPASRCGAGSVTLAATGSVGTTIKWYAGPSGGATLASGGSYPTASLGVGVTPFYAAASQVFGTENGGKGAFTPGTGFVTTNWGIVFTAATDIVLNTVDVYPYGTGDIVIGLYASDATTLLAETPSIPVTGTGTLQTVTLGFDVPAGADYRIMIKSYSGITGLGRDAGTFPNSSPSGSFVATASEWGGTTTGTNYFFYNFNISRSCDSPRSLVNATVTAPPFLGVNTPNNTICSGLTTSGNAFGAGYTTYTWTPATGVSPAGPGAIKTLSPTVTTSYVITATGGGCNNSTNLTIYVKPSPTNPTPVVAVAPGGICLGASKSLSTTASAGGNLVLFNADFNDNTLGGWTLTNGGTSPTNWQVVTAPYTYAAQITAFSVTPTPSPFIIINSDILGSGSSAGFANIVSPSFSTVGHSSVTLAFDHVYRTVGSNISATVQYSTDGGLTWSADVYSTTATTPAQTWTAGSIVTTSQVIVLPGGAGNQANVKLRFRCDYDWDYYWMVDNIQVYSPATVEYRWSSAFAFAGIPAPAQAYANANNSISVTPTAGGSMTYTVDVRNSQGCVALTPASHSANVSDVTIAPTNTGPQRVGTTLVISTTATGGFGGYSFQWRKTSGFGSGPAVINATNSFSYVNAQVTHSGTYQATVQDGQGCSNVLTTDALVYAALVWNGSQGSSWTNPLNWTPPIVPTNDCAENVAITSSGTPPVFPGPSQNIGNFALEEGSTLTLNSNLQVCGSLTGSVTGVSSVVGTGNVELTGTGVAFVSGKARLTNLIINKSAGSQVRFTGTTYLTDLMTISNNNAAISVDPSGTVVLESTPTGTAKIGPIPAGTTISVSNPGKFVMKRYIPFAVPYSANNGQWFFLGSAMAPKPFTDWSDDFKMAGTSTSFATQGSAPEMAVFAEPAHTTVFKYTESLRKGRVDTVQKRGWRYPVSLDLIALGRGYRTYINRYGNADEFDNTGMINYGNVTFPTLTSTDEPVCSNSASDWCYTDDRGYNLVSNPYPCDIDWEASAVAWPKAPSMQNAYYRWVSDLGGYGSYANGGLWTGVVPAPGNPRYIPSSQGFFVKLNPAGATYNETMTITEAAKSTAVAGSYARTATNDYPMIRMHMTQPSLNGSYGFETVVRFMDEASDLYDFNYDYSAMGGNRFYMSLPVGNQELAVNSLHTLTASQVVPVRTYYKGSYGNFEFRFTGISTLPTGCGVYLKDNFLNIIHDLNAVPTYSFEVASGNSSEMADRFELVFSPNSVTGASKQIGGINFGLYPNPTKGKNVTLILGGVKDVEGSVVILDVLGKEVYSTSVNIKAEGITEKSLDIDLASGMYSVKFTTKSQTFTEKLIVR